MQRGPLSVLIAIGLLLSAAPAFGDSRKSTSLSDGPRVTTFANLGTLAAGKTRWCTDCDATSPCTSGGAGAFAYAVTGGTVNCNDGSGGGAATGDVVGPASSTANHLAVYADATGKLLADSFTGTFVGATGTFGATSTAGTLKLFDGAGTGKALQIRSSGGTGPVPVRTLLINNATWTADHTITLINDDLTLVGTTNAQTLSGPKTLESPIISTGLANGTGAQHARTAGCTTAASANATCDTTVTWPVAFADTNYTVVATLDSPSGGVVFVKSTKNKTTTTVDVTLVTITAAASSGTINLIGIHD
jgi:hypothetical protein